MDRVKRFHNPKIYIALAITLILSVIIFPDNERFTYKYQKGKVWNYKTLISPIDFPILKTKAELNAEEETLAQKIIPYYSYRSETTRNELMKLSKLPYDNEVLDAFNMIYDKGLIGEFPSDNNMEKIIIVQRGNRASEVPATEIFDLKTAKRYLQTIIDSLVLDHKSDSIYRELSFSDYLVPNLVYDQTKSETVHKEAIDYISPTRGMVYTGQLIVSQGEIVTAEVKQLLDSYKAEFESNLGSTGSIYVLKIGHTLMIAIILILILAIIYFIYSKIFNNMNKFYFILLLFLLVEIVTVFIGDIKPNNLYMVPYAVFALYLVAFFKQKFSFPIYAVLLLPVLILSPNGIELYFMNLFVGAITMISFSYLNKGWLQFLNSVAIYVGLLLAYTTFRLIAEGNLDYFDYSMLYKFAANAIFVVCAYPLVFLFGKMFSLVSTSRLVDLSDTNERLLLELATKAPGTFQHSLQVSNLSIAAAREIGGDVALIRAGALYHDIGKMNNPQCFIENEAPGVNYHSTLTPMESSAQIIRHVDEGVEIAKKHRLPDVIIDFIKTHHAQSYTGYFYTTYINQGGDPENKEPFRYHGVLPKTKEQAILMLADTVEAMARSMVDHSEKSISDLVDNLFASRLSTDSQLVDADISLHELSIIKEVFKVHLKQMYHGRIKYPKRKDIKEFESEK